MLSAIYSKVHCWVYTIYDKMKPTFPIRWLFYKGKKFEHHLDEWVYGTVTRVGMQALDGDWTFDIINDKDGRPLHCEITPCYPIDQSILARLKEGAIVLLYGTHTFDPAHLGNADKWEIHPVKVLSVGHWMESEPS